MTAERPGPSGSGLQTGHHHHCEDEGNHEDTKHGTKAGRIKGEEDHAQARPTRRRVLLEHEGLEGQKDNNPYVFVSFVIFVRKIVAAMAA